MSLLLELKLWKDYSSNGNAPIKPGEVVVDSPVVLVLGNEGLGISKDVLKACEFNIVIPQIFGPLKSKVRVKSTRYKDDNDEDDIIVSKSVNESLNVGVATGILLHSISGS